MSSKSKILATSLDASIYNDLSNRKTRNFINDLVSKYIDYNVEVLQNPAPQYRLFFTDKREREPIYKLMGITPEYIKELLNKIPEIDSNWKIMNDPFFIIMTMIIRNLCKMKLTNREIKLTFDNSLMYLTFAMYSSLQYKYFRVPPNEDIINYTVNDISNKFLFKKYGSVFKAIEHVAMVSHNKYTKDLLSDYDTDIINYLVSLRNRLNGVLLKFKNAYEQNRKNGRYMTTETDNPDPDNYKDTTNVSVDIERISNDLTIKFFTSATNERLVRMSAQASGISAPVLKNVIDSIKDNESESVSRLISYIIQIFLSEPGNSITHIKSKKFIVDAIKIYSMSNTKDERVLGAKDILNDLLNKYCEKYLKVENYTKNAYKKALYSYFVFFIAYSS